LNVSREGASTASLGNLSQGFTALAFTVMAVGVALRSPVTASVAEAWGQMDVFCGVS